MSHCRGTVSRRSGYTLREVTVAMAIGSTVMMTAVSLLHEAFDWSTAARKRRMDDQTFYRLSSDLRGDLHSASEASLGSGADDKALDCDLVSKSVRYQFDDQSVTRTEIAGGAIVAREVYRWQNPKRTSSLQWTEQGQLQFGLRAVTPHAPEQVPLWRRIRISPGLRLKHQRGEIKS